MSARKDTIAKLQKSKIYSTLLSDADRKNVMLQALYNAQQKKIEDLEKANKVLIEVNEQKRVALFKIKKTINEYFAAIRAENSKEAKK